jgi:2-polyprenyl-3-methyl-5-hydroxy-6-metoxy-1,4-benzoquinol methylase
MAEWQREAVEFDNLYGKSWEHKIPYFGRVLRDGLRRREEGALAVAGELEGTTVLDLGCGVGRFALRAASRGAVVHGYDISPSAIEIAKAKAREAGLADRCHFTSADLASVDFPPADIWYDLGCFQYIPDVVPILERLTHVPRFFSELPQSGHWQNVPRLIYRRLLKGNPYYTYSEARIHDVFSVVGDVKVEARGLSYWITPQR